MTKQDKRNPCFEDTSLMVFGKYKNQLLQDIPASYFRWLKDILEKEGYNYNPPEKLYNSMKSFEQDKVKLYNYIWNSQDALQMELGNDIV
ncbi:MAG TPA: DUF3820 family protein [Blattabacteriaceae bacterium]